MATAKAAEFLRRTGGAAALNEPDHVENGVFSWHVIRLADARQVFGVAPQEGGQLRSSGLVGIVHVLAGGSGSCRCDLGGGSAWCLRLCTARCISRVPQPFRGGVRGKGHVLRTGAVFSHGGAAHESLDVQAAGQGPAGRIGCAGLRAMAPKRRHCAATAAAARRKKARNTQHAEEAADEATLLKGLWFV